MWPASQFWARGARERYRVLRSDTLWERAFLHMDGRLLGGRPHGTLVLGKETLRLFGSGMAFEQQRLGAVSATALSFFFFFLDWAGSGLDEHVMIGFLVV